MSKPLNIHEDIDFENLYNKLLEFKFENSFYNIVLNKDYLSDLIDKLKFDIELDKDVQIKNKDDLIN